MANEFIIKNGFFSEGNSNVTGSLTATSFTGSLLGTASYATTVLSASYATTASYLSGTITSASFATTSSYVNTLNQDVIITGSLAVTSSISINNSTYSNQTNTVDSETKTIVSIFSAGAVHMDYYVTDGSSARAGVFVGTWDGGGSREFYETATNDIGNTTDVVFTVTLPGGQMDIDCTTTTNGWTVLTNTRTLTV